VNAIVVAMPRAAMGLAAFDTAVEKSNAAARG
jgi:hypothetical protein